jgi:hypothetical protein
MVPMGDDVDVTDDRAFYQAVEHLLQGIARPHRAFAVVTVVE